MIKKTFAIFAIICFGLETTQAAEPLFLNQQELQSLSLEQRARYFREVQRVLATMAQRSLYLSEGPRSEQRRRPANSSNITAAEFFEQTYEHVFDDSTKSARSDVKAGSGSSGGGLAGSEAKPDPTRSERPRSGLASAPATAAPPVEKKGQAVIAERVPEAKVTVERVLDTRVNFRCMYAGWVIPDDPCVGHQKFPSYYELKGSDPSKMTCPSHQTMCNPTVFGLRLPKECQKFSSCPKEARPLCVSKGTWPTVDCYHSSDFKSAIVAAEINTEVNPEHYKTYSKVFKDLCDSEQIEKNRFADPKNRKFRRHVTPEEVKNDIRITCSWAEQKLQQIRLAMTPGKSLSQDEWKKQQAEGAKKATDRPGASGNK
jgi:hypothetical protein